MIPEPAVQGGTGDQRIPGAMIAEAGAMTVEVGHRVIAVVVDGIGVAAVQAEGGIGQTVVVLHVVALDIRLHPQYWLLPIRRYHKLCKIKEVVDIRQIMGDTPIVLLRDLTRRHHRTILTRQPYMLCHLLNTRQVDMMMQEYLSRYSICRTLTSNNSQRL